MSELLKYTMFHDVLFPPGESANDSQANNLLLKKLIHYRVDPEIDPRESKIVVFDFETTGLDTRDDRIIEVGAQKLVNMKPVDEFTTLIKTDIPLTSAVMQLTGIDHDMLRDKPMIDEVLPDFLSFIEDAVLVAHNADFDMGFLRAACDRIGFQLNWPCFCTVKLSRALLPELESRNLDRLAEHYGLSFESRHRSIGDVKVTSAVLEKLLNVEGKQLTQYKDLTPYWVQIKD